MVKQFSDEQVDKIIRIKFGRMVSSQYHTSYVSNALLGRLFGCSGSKIRQMYLRRFCELSSEKRNEGQNTERMRYGIRFVPAEM